MLAGGVLLGKARQSGSERKMDAIVSLMSSPSKQRLPVSISYSTRPNEKISLR